MPDRWPDLHVLELLIAIAERGSLSAAARAVGIAQPNATRAISKLERSFGIRLVERQSRGSVLTEDGATVAEWVRVVLDAATRLKIATEALRNDRQSLITISASMTVAECLIPTWLTEFRRLHSGIAIKLHVYNSEDVFDAVESSACDVGFVESPGVRANVISMPVDHDRLVVVVSGSHPWARRNRPVTAAELAATRLVVREAGSGTRGTLDLALDGLVQAPPLLELDSNAAVMISVEAGAGPAVLSELVVRSKVRSGELVVVPVEGVQLQRTIRAVWNRSTELNLRAEDLVRIARRPAA